MKKINIKKLLDSKNILRKINSQSEITFLSKKFTRKFLNDINLKIDLAYGRMNFSKKSSVANNILNCNGNINFLEEFPLLFLIVILQ